MAETVTTEVATPAESVTAAAAANADAAAVAAASAIASAERVAEHATENAQERIEKEVAKIEALRSDVLWIKQQAEQSPKMISALETKVDKLEALTAELIQVVKASSTRPKPSGSKEQNSEVIQEPAAAAKSDADQTAASSTKTEPKEPTKGSGNERGSKPQQKAASLHIGGLEKLLISIHVMAAAWTDTAELKLADDEAKMMADAMADVQRHYGIIVGDKNIAWANLIIACGAIYGPRFIIIREKMKQKNSPVQPMDRRNVVPIA